LVAGLTSTGCPSERQMKLDARRIGRWGLPPTPAHRCRRCVSPPHLRASCRTTQVGAGATAATHKSYWPCHEGTPAREMCVFAITMKSMITSQEIIVRLLVALLLSGAVGFQRALTGKAAGMRTHILVGVGSALFTLVSGYAFHTTASNADRIAAQIVSGIGFIGGGAILKERGSIK